MEKTNKDIEQKLGTSTTRPVARVVEEINNKIGEPLDGQAPTLFGAINDLSKFKHLLYNTAGETTIKDKDGNILTHAQIYTMLIDEPDFVVLIRSDHAFHPNLVTPTQIAFTCSYLGADGEISAERVNITSENVVTYTSGKGVMFNSNSGVVMGSGSAGLNSLSVGASNRANGGSCIAHGDSCSANAIFSHAEGLVSVSNGRTSHAEGEHCTTYGALSHAEGNYCSSGTNGGSAHAEGSYTNVNGAASHAEGYRTVTTEGGSHAQGCWNKVEGGQFAFMHGCGTSEDDRKNAFLISGSAIYILGIGGYDGTNAGQEGVLSLQEYLLSMQQ